MYGHPDGVFSGWDSNCVYSSPCRVSRRLYIFPYKFISKILVSALKFYCVVQHLLYCIVK